MHLDFERNRFSEIPTAGFTIMPHMQQRGPRRSARHLRLLFGVSLMALLDAAAASPGAVSATCTRW